MQIYLDSSGLIKRVVEEPQSDSVVAAIEGLLSEDALLVTSSLSRIEVSRAMARLIDAGAITPESGREAVQVALSGVRERPISGNVVSLSRRISPPLLRTLDAIHLATAVLADSDGVITYDSRLMEACGVHDLPVLTP